MVDTRLEHHFEELFGRRRSFPLIHDLRFVRKTHIRGHIYNVAEFITQHERRRIPITHDERIG